MRKMLICTAFASIAFSLPGQLFWSVSGNGLEKDSYILGTAHNAPVSMIDEVKGLNEAIRNCDIAIGEIDRNDSSEPELSMADLLAPADSTLDKLLSPEDYHVVEETVNKCLESTEASMAELRIFKPGLISMLTMDMDLSAEPDTNNNVSFDIAILERAAAAGHPTMGFETQAEHLDWMLKAPLKDQATWLVSKCKNYDNLEGLDEAYISQDPTVQFESRTPDEGYREIFVYRRNRNWAEKLDQMMSEQSCLVCVGVNHLSGNKGLLQLLRDLGYTVEAVQ